MSERGVHFTSLKERHNQAATLFQEENGTDDSVPSFGSLNLGQTYSIQ